MPRCDICDETVDKVTKCKDCGAKFCEDCGDEREELCIYSEDEEI